MAELECVHVVCPCPGTPHPDGDDVFLRPSPGIVGGTMINNRYLEISREFAAETEAGTADSTDQAEAIGKLMQVYLRAGIERWTLVDAEGQPLPVNKVTIAGVLEPNWRAASAVADRADDLYRSVVLDPLVKPAASSSRPTPTSASTSASRSDGSTPTDRSASRTRRAKRSKRSSTSTTQTGAIEPITASPAGDSS